MANEKRLIDTNEAYEIARSSRLHDDFGISMADLTSLKELLEDCTTVDAVEVVHAHWEDGCGVDCYGNIAYKSIDCSHCKEIFKIESRTREYWRERFKVCPFCGAKMDGGDEDG
jgi:hypothetical protein